MPATPQEELLTQRLAQLDKLDQQLSVLNPVVGLDKQDQTGLKQDVDRQRKALSEEITLRAAYRSQCEALWQLQSHEQLKQQLRKLHDQRDLTDGEVANYLDSRDKCRAALSQAGAPNASPLNVEAALAQLRQKQAELQKDFLELRAENADLFQNTSGVAEPCIPCIQKRVDLISKNIEHKARAAKSMAAFSGQQNNKDTCALMSVQSILLETTGEAPPEGWSANSSMLRSYTPAMREITYTVQGGTDMIDIGKQSKRADGQPAYKPCNGTTDEAAVMTAAGVPATLKKKPSLAEIAEELDDGKAVNVAYDARPVWYGTSAEEKAKWPPNALGHTVRVTGVDHGPDGSVRGLYINDSGSGEPGKYVPAEAFQQALSGFNGGRMASSNTPIHAPVP